MSKLTSKVAVVTGASKSIGAAIAKTLAANGAALVVNYVSSKSGAGLAVEAITSAGRRAVAVQWPCGSRHVSLPALGWHRR